MSIKDNINKTRRYIRRNGLNKAVFAVAERVTAPKHPEYDYVPISESELIKQREAYKSMTYKPLISLLVPAYNTKPEYLQALISSVEAQTYENWELIIVDASETPLYIPSSSEKIRYRKLDRNQGISGNTNEALVMAKGEYTGLLDHDDILTPDCLFDVVKAIEKRPDAVLIYTDEDKTDSEGNCFYDPNRKRSFNRDMFLTNNYICHFTCIQTIVLQKLMFRPDYDGAQDYDMFLRVVETCTDEQIVHIPKILYHWRCHEESTAMNTDSKSYAYEAGKRALQDYCDRQGWDVEVQHTDHLGFYRIHYKVDVFLDRLEVGAVGGPITRLGRVVAGALTLNGRYLYTGQPFAYSGYLHRAKLQQRVYATDLRNLRVCPELTLEYEEYLDRIYKGEDPIEVSLQFANLVYESGRIILYDPLQIRR